jgi:hypothetical protein
MPTQSALEIVNALFAGQKDLSDYVDSAMKIVAVDQIDAKKQEVGSSMFKDPDESPEVEASAETEVTDTPPEETTDETDQRGD